MKKILPILAVAFLAGCTIPEDSQTTSLPVDSSEETTSLVASSEEVSSEELISSEVTSSEEVASSEEVVSSEEVSSSEVVVSSEEVGSSETEPEVFAPDLFISEYIEGASNNKALELANFTGADINLSEYTVQLFGNGSSASTRTQALTGTLKHGEVFVLAGALTADQGMLDALALIPEERKIVTTWEEGSIPAAYNGDDAVAILKGDAIIDVFGTIGFDPGAGWDQYIYGQVAEGVTATTVDRTLTRLPGFGPKVGLIEAYTAFDPTEWKVEATHTQTLGTHLFI